MQLMQNSQFQQLFVQAQNSQIQMFPQIPRTSFLIRTFFQIKYFSELKLFSKGKIFFRINRLYKQLSVMF